MEAMNLPPVTEVTPEQARIDAKLRPSYPGPDVARVKDMEIPVSLGTVPVRVYTPSTTGPYPVLIWIHGGGWVTGDLDMADGTARQLCAGAGCLVVSVGYALSPEAKFPTALRQCYEALQCVKENAATFGADGTRIAVGGDSAGGNLAAAVCLMARDEGGPPIDFQLLIYPVTEADFETESYVQNATGFMLTREAMQWYWDHYLTGPEDATDPYAAPLRASDLSGLPPALVITAEYDPLRDEGEEYAHRLESAGVPTALTRYNGMIHGFFGRWGAIDRSLDAIRESCDALKKAFAA
jgi:acetyl esterase